MANRWFADGLAIRSAPLRVGPFLSGCDETGPAFLSGVVLVQSKRSKNDSISIPERLSLGVAFRANP